MAEEQNRVLKTVNYNGVLYDLPLNVIKNIDELLSRHSATARAAEDTALEPTKESETTENDASVEDSGDENSSENENSESENGEGDGSDDGEAKQD